MLLLIRERVVPHRDLIPYGRGPLEQAFLQRFPMFDVPGPIRSSEGNEPGRQSRDAKDERLQNRQVLFG